MSELDTKSFRKFFSEKVLTTPVTGVITPSLLVKAREAFNDGRKDLSTSVEKPWPKLSEYISFAATQEFKVVHRTYGRTLQESFVMLWGRGILLTLDVIDDRVRSTTAYGVFKPNMPYYSFSTHFKIRPVDLAKGWPGGVNENPFPVDLAYFIQVELSDETFGTLRLLNGKGKFLEEWPPEYGLFNHVQAYTLFDAKIQGKSVLYPSEYTQISMRRLRSLPPLVCRSLGMRG